MFIIRRHNPKTNDNFLRKKKKKMLISLVELIDCMNAYFN